MRENKGEGEKKKKGVHEFFSKKAGLIREKKTDRLFPAYNCPEGGFPVGGGIGQWFPNGARGSRKNYTNAKDRKFKGGLGFDRD